MSILKVFKREPIFIKTTAQCIFTFRSLSLEVVEGDYRNVFFTFLSMRPFFSKDFHETFRILLSLYDMDLLVLGGQDRTHSTFYDPYLYILSFLVDATPLHTSSYDVAHSILGS